MPSGAKIQLVIDADSKKAEANLKRFQAEATKAASSVSNLDQAASARHLEKFEDRLSRNAKAARYFGGETAALEKEQQMLRREIERLIRKGMDPLDAAVGRLKKRYDANAASLRQATSANASYSASVKSATAATAAFIRTALPFVGVAAAIGSATRVISESGEAFQEAEARAQKFAITYEGITDLAAERAKQLADAFNYADSTMMGILAETGDLLTGFGLAGQEALELSEKATYLGAALAKMNPNIGDAASATSDLTKLMSGEGESMKKWGVIVRDSAVQARLLEQGLTGLTGEALLQAQAQARLEIAYNQSKNALTNITSETVLALDVARRYDEAWKERKEIVGEATTNFFTPIKLKIAEQIEAWNDATLAKKNYDAALAGDPTADLSAAIAKQQQEVDDLYKQLEKFANPDTLAKKWFYEGADWLRTAVGGNTVVDEILAEIREEELRLQQLKDQLSDQENSSSPSGSQDSRIAQYQASAEELEKVSSAVNTQVAAIDRLSQAHAKAGIEFDGFARKQTAARKALTDLVSGGVINTEHLDQFIAAYQDLLSDVESVPDVTPVFDVDEATRGLDAQLSIVDQIQAAYGQVGREFDGLSRKQSLVLKTFEAVASAGADTSAIDEFIAAYREFLELPESTKPGPVITSSEAFTSYREELDEQISSIDNLAGAYAKAGIEFDIFGRKQQAAREILDSIVNTGDLNRDDLDAFIAAYRGLLADVSEESLPVPDISFSELSEDLSGQIASIDQISAAYARAGGEFDTFAQKQLAVKKTFEALAEMGADTTFLDGFIAQYGEFLEAGEKTQSIADVLSSVDEAAFNLRQQYAQMGIELSETESKTQVLEEKLAQLSETGEYTRWELYQIELALQNLGEEADQTRTAWDLLADSMSSAMSGFVEDAVGSLASGEFDVAASAESAIDSVIGGAADAAMAAFPQFAPLIALGEGAIKGLNKAIFETISAAKDAKNLIDEQHEAITELFTDVLDLEAELSAQRIDSINEQMELLSSQHDLEMEILRERWQHGEISGEEYFNQAMAANDSYREGESSYDRQSQLIEGVQGTIEDLRGQLDGLSGWTKFWTKADENLEEEIGKYEKLLAAISGFDGLSESEIMNLASTYGITVPGAARGADFITSGPMLMAVGDNPGGKERVQISPITSSNVHGPQNAGGSDVHIHISGDVYGVDDLYARLDAAGKRLKKLGRVSA
jgi:hypothetical protein